VDGATANDLSGQIPEELKQERLARLMQLQEQISRERLQAKVGTEMLVLVDEVLDDRVIARGEADAPEVDGNVIIQGGWDLDPGDFIQVMVTSAGEHDLFATPSDIQD